MPKAVCPGRVCPNPQRGTVQNDCGRNNGLVEWAVRRRLGATWGKRVRPVARFARTERGSAHGNR
jgi:hypothetical protein